MITREELFAQGQPETKEQALAFLHDMQELGLLYHLDDDPREIITNLGGERTFSDKEAAFLSDFVDNLNVLFADAGPEEERDRINAGAWEAVQQAGWLDGLKGDDGIATEESVRRFVDAMLDDDEQPPRRRAAPSSGELINKLEKSIALASMRGDKEAEERFRRALEVAINATGAKDFMG